MEFIKKQIIKRINQITTLQEANLTDGVWAYQIIIWKEEIELMIKKLKSGS